jgi:hypothetical protein
LRGVGWVDSNDLPPGCRRFTLEEGEELSPTNIGCLYNEIGKAVGFDLVNIFTRPVTMRTERNGKEFFEFIIHFVKI